MICKVVLPATMCTVHTEHMYKIAVVLSLQAEKYGLSFVKLHSPAEVSNDEPMDTDTL